MPMGREMNGWGKLRSEIGWPAGGVSHLFSCKVTAVVLGYYLLSLILDKLLPAQEVYGTKLVHQYGRPLKYRLNGKQRPAQPLDPTVFAADLNVFRTVTAGL
ncbi:delta-sterol reductase [Diplodia corticola]|uniref:Delta-sterol reductase n=1 Tax=Diplodia corticola TaxID=236234 RepID=A0A1J9SHJ4_9PEZI|nr:delta-sterol reductase [Diplodia corticola]OJD39061.1 delta-sterol reductase [Diplodia corticola]